MHLILWGRRFGVLRFPLCPGVLDKLKLDFGGNGSAFIVCCSDANFGHVTPVVNVTIGSGVSDRVAASRDKACTAVDRASRRVSHLSLETIAVIRGICFNCFGNLK